MALTAMCFDVLHSEIVHRIKSVVTEIKRGSVINLGSHESHNEYTMPPWQYEKNTNLYKRNATEETLLVSGE